MLGFWTHPSPIHRIARFITLGNFVKKCSLKYMQSILAASQLPLLGALQSHLSCELRLLFSVVKLKVAHAASVEKSIASLKMGETLFPIQKGKGRLLLVMS